MIEMTLICDHVLDGYNDLIMEIGGNIHIITEETSIEEKQEAEYWNPLLRKWISDLEVLREDHKKKVYGGK